MRLWREKKYQIVDFVPNNLRRHNLWIKMHYTNTGSIYREWKIRARFLSSKKKMLCTFLWNLEPWIESHWNRTFAPFQRINSSTKQLTTCVFLIMNCWIAHQPRIFSRVILIANKIQCAFYIMTYYLKKKIRFFILVLFLSSWCDSTEFLQANLF